MDFSHLQEHHPFISKTRDRSSVLNLLVPKILGIVWEKGLPSNGIGISAKVNGGIGLFVSNHLTLDVHAPMKSNSKKVLSAYVSAVRVGDEPKLYRYCEGHVSIMSWHRGEWEDSIMADSAGPLSISRGFLLGLFHSGYGTQ
ncbi:MAG: hypothetical protein ACXWJW_14230 [Xanthobacteraceae bacterium]